MGLIMKKIGNNEDLKPDQPLALFDVDGVLVRPYVIEHFPRYIIEHNFNGFNAESFQEMEELKTAYEKVQLSYEEFASRLINAYAHGIVGQSEAYVSQLAKDFWDHSKSIAYPYTLELIHLIRPYFSIVAISGSPTMALMPMLLEWNFDLVFATEIQTTPDKIYNGIVEANRATRQGKNRVVELLKTHTSPDVWNKSIAFGDHPTHDFPLLKNVQAPFLFMDNKRFNKKDKTIQELTNQIPLLKTVDRGLEKHLILSTVQNQLKDLDILPTSH